MAALLDFFPDLDRALSKENVRGRIEKADFRKALEDVKAPSVKSDARLDEYWQAAVDWCGRHDETKIALFSKSLIIAKLGRELADARAEQDDKAKREAERKRENKRQTAQNEITRFFKRQIDKDPLWLPKIIHGIKCKTPFVLQYDAEKRLEVKDSKVVKFSLVEWIQDKPWETPQLLITLTNPVSGITRLRATISNSDEEWPEWTRIHADDICPYLRLVSSNYFELEHPIALDSQWMTEHMCISKSC
jgi:hypothetical protein